jgi:predicted MPP superfamily phosphohydrolase
MQLDFLRPLLLAGLIVLVQSFWLGRGWGLAAHFRRPWLQLAWRIFLLLFAVALAAIVFDRLIYRFLSPSITIWLAPPIQLWLFTSVAAAFVLFAVRLLSWIASLFASSPVSIPAQPDPRRRHFLRRATAILTGMPFVVAVYGYAFERLRFQVVRLDMPIANLPPALDGLRIVQLSDIHIGDFMPPGEIRRAVRLANSLSAHLAVLTGDFVTSQGDPLAECVEELSGLRAPLGVWGCNGNHEIYAGVQRAAQDLFRLHGMTLLRQSSAQLQWNGAPFNLIGIDYAQDIPFTGSAPIDHIAPLVRRDMPNILLSHNPNTFPSAANLGIEFSLAGHTHGGQITLNFVNPYLNPARLMTRFVAGPFRLPMPQLPGAAPTPNPPRASLYVNRGLGTLAVPARLGSNPEITLLTLRREGTVA